MRTRDLLLLFSLCAAGCGGSAQPASSLPASPPDSPTPSTSVVVGSVPTTSDGMAAIVFLEPRQGNPAPAETMSAPAVMDQFGQAFSPALLLAQQGQPVEFRNSEDTLHNVRVYHVESREPAFNISLTQGGKYTHKFERQGFYAVSCDIHPAMTADIFVTSTPYAAVADDEGRFTFSDVQAGHYTLIVLRGGDRTTRDVQIQAPRTDLTAQPK